MNYFYFVGIDVAKMSFDATILNFEEKEIAYSQFENNDKGIKLMLKWVKTHQINLSETLFCAENMGTYVNSIAYLSQKKKFNLVLACPLSIKKSMGIVRGKNDKIDSLRIASYLLRNYRQLELYIPVSDTIKQLKNWLILRENLIKERVAISLIISDFDGEMESNLSKQIKLGKMQKESLSNNITEIDKQIAMLIETDLSVKKNADLLMSVKGVGLIVATVLITTTNNFNNFTNYRKYACYCGVAPFEYSSGKSIHGKTKVSKTANVRIKTYISRSAISAIRFDEQTKKYVKRKLDEGKHIASVTNAVKCKIIARCFAVVKRGTPYVSLQI